MDEKTIQRIKKLQALAERGVGGEKTTAQELDGRSKPAGGVYVAGKCKERLQGGLYCI